MAEIELYGKIGKIIGRNFRLNCNKLTEVFHAIEQITGKLKKYIFLNKKRNFAIFVDGQYVNTEEFHFCEVKNKKVVIMPVLMGALGTTIATLIVAGSLTAALTTAQTVAVLIIGGIINAALAIGISLLMQKLFAPDDPNNNQINTKSFSFNGAENVAQQGIPVPVGYGRLRCGSRLISVNYISTDLQIFESDRFYKIKSNSELNSSVVYESENGGSTYAK